jgi:multiple sugar transport system permease protein
MKNIELIKNKNKHLTQQQTLGILFIIPTVVFLVVFVVYPVLYNVFLSFTNAKLLKSDYTFIAFDNYKKVFTNPRFFKYVKNTLVWTFFSVIGQLGIGLALALLINHKSSGPGLRSFLLVPYVVPAVAIALVTKWIMNGDYGIVSYWMQNIGLIAHRQSALAIPGSAMVVLVIVNIWRSYPFPMLIYWATLKGINKELYEAASVDGANKFQKFFYITLPHLRDITIVLVILRIVWTATYFDLIWLISGGGPAGSTTHLPIMIYQASFGTFQTGYASSISVILGFCLFLCVVFYVRKSIESEL